jgi:predicted nucleotidyltransferase
MTHKIWQKKQKLNFSKDVIDIVQFGSSIVEDSNPNDIDIAVIFNKIPLKNQLLESQKIKRQLEKLSEIPIHINSFDFYSLFDKSNFAKDNLLFLGKSILSGDFFVKKFGLNPRVQIYYSLFNLDKKDKVRFNYMLNGRKGVYGLLRKYSGKLLKPGLIEILPEHEEVFVLGIKKFGIKFEVKRIFLMN